MGSYTSKTSEPQDRKPVDSDLISLGGSTLHADTTPYHPDPDPRRQATHIPRNFGTSLSHLQVSLVRAVPIIGVIRNHFFNETGEVNWYATPEVINTLWRLRIFFEKEGHGTCSNGYICEIREYRAAINLLAKSLYEMSLCAEPEMARKGMTELRRDSIRDLKARSKRGLEKLRAAIKDWREAEVCESRCTRWQIRSTGGVLSI
jgi:hypothetical protein